MTERNAELALGGAPAEGAAAPRGPGRPKGAKNKRGRDWQAYANSLGVHPLMLMLGDVNKTDRQLAEELELVQRDDKDRVKLGADGKPLLLPTALRQARALRYDAAAQALPYIEQKLPALDENEDGGRKQILMIVGNVSPDQAAAIEQRGLHFALKQNQQVSEAEVVKSDAQQSDDAPNQLTFNEDR
jgi:hypothetical protein